MYIKYINTLSEMNIKNFLIGYFQTFSGVAIIILSLIIIITPYLFSKSIIFDFLYMLLWIPYIIVGLPKIIDKIVD